MNQPNTIIVDGITLISKSEAAKLCLFSKQHITKLVRQGQLKPPRYDRRTGRAWYQKKDILNLKKPVLVDTFQETNIAGKRSTKA
jgi:hypothetical protein